jgi:hypothetical protein
MSEDSSCGKAEFVSGMRPFLLFYRKRISFRTGLSLHSFQLHSVFIGLTDSPYEGGLFFFKLSLHTIYPYPERSVSYYYTFHPTFHLCEKYVHMSGAVRSALWMQVLNSEAANANTSGVLLQSAVEATLTYAQ